MGNQRFIGAVGYLLDTITKSGKGQETEVIIKLKFRLPEEENPTLYASTVTEALRRLLDSKELFRKLVKLDKEELTDPKKKQIESWDKFISEISKGKA